MYRKVHQMFIISMTHLFSSSCSIFFGSHSSQIFSFFFYFYHFPFSSFSSLANYSDTLNLSNAFNLSYCVQFLSNIFCFGFPLLLFCLIFSLLFLLLLLILFRHCHALATSGEGGEAIITTILPTLNRVPCLRDILATTSPSPQASILISPCFSSPSSARLASSLLSRLT